MPNAGPTLENVQLMQAFTESTFGTDATGSLGSFTAIPFQEGTAQFTIDREQHNPLQSLQHVHDYQEEILGKKAATLRFTLPFMATGTAPASTVAAVQSPLGLLLKNVMGGETLGTGSTAAAGWTAVTGDAAAGTFSKGSAVGWVNSSSELELRPLKNVSGATLTNKLAFSGSPSNGNVLYSAATYYLTSDPDASLQFVVRGLESQDEFVLLGGQLDSMTFNLPLDGSIPTVQFAFKFASWLYGADSAGSASLTDLTPVTYSNFDPIVGHQGRLLVQTNGTTTYSASSLPTVHASALSFEPALAYAPITSPSGVQGILRWRMTRASGTPRIAGSFSTFFENTSDFFAARDSKLDKLIWYQNGLTAGSAWAIEVPTAQFGPVQRVNAGGIASQQVMFKGRRDGDIASATTDQHFSPIRIHFC